MTTNTDPWGKQLEWEQVGIDTYDLNLSSTTISVGSNDGDGNFPYLFRIIDENGRELEQVIETANARAYRIRELYQAVSRSHSGLDNKLTEIMNELGIKDPDDEPPF